MNPYSRFGLVSNTISAAILLSVMAAAGPRVLDTIQASMAGDSGMMLTALGGGVIVMVVFWMAMTEAIFPMLFRLNAVRRMVSGKYYFEGTWLQSEKGEDHKRMSVIDIQPAGKSFIFSGYSLNEDLQIESNSLIEFSKLDWPFMTYKYRNSLSDGADGKRDGVGEIQFEMNRAAAQRYNGFVQYVRGHDRLRIEGAKLTSNSEVKNLRTLQGRQRVFQKYWELFFKASVHTAKIEQNRPVQAAPRVEEESDIDQVLERYEAEAAGLERRKASAETSAKETVIVPRRRSTDWGPAQVDDSQTKISDPYVKATTKTASER